MEHKQTLIEYIQSPQHFAEAIANLPRSILGTEGFEPRRGISHVGLYREMLSNNNVKRYFAEHLPDFAPPVFEKLLQFFGIKENDIHVFFDNESPRFFAMQQPIIPFKPFNSVENASGTFAWEHNSKMAQDEFSISGIHNKRIYSARYIHKDKSDAYVLDQLDFGVVDEEPKIPSLSITPFKLGPDQAGLVTNYMVSATKLGYKYSIGREQMNDPFISLFVTIPLGFAIPNSNK